MVEKKWIVKKRNKKDLIEQILSNRGLKSKKEIEEFLNPNLAQIPDPLSLPGVKKAVKRIKEAIDEKEAMIVFGDYDADGICGTAILWETIYQLGGEVLPFIPSREEGYSLNLNAIQSFRDQGIKLIITTDCGITSVEEIKKAKELGMDVIVTDHHQKPEKIPSAFSIIHSDQMAGVGVAFIFAQALKKSLSKRIKKTEFLDLLALGTVADMVPLIGINRTFTKFGLRELNQTQRIGLKVLIKEAGLRLGDLKAYEVGYIIAPRLNAIGRLHHAIDSLRLLCTRDLAQAVDLAKKLQSKNVERQSLTKENFQEAKEMILKKKKLDNVLIVESEKWPEGIIGLVAGKLAGEFYRPSAAISKGEKVSKGSARSIQGFNLIENLRLIKDVFVDLGGHPMAAGFSIKNEKIDEFKSRFASLAQEKISQETLTPVLEIDAQINLDEIDFGLVQKIHQLEPFGIGNPEPVLLSEKVEVVEKRLVGKAKDHLKLKVKQERSNVFDVIGFNFSDQAKGLDKGSKIDLVYTINEDNWMNRRKIQLKIKDLKTPQKDF